MRSEEEIMEKQAAALARVRQLFPTAAFIRDLGIRLDDLGPGWAETSLTVEPRFAQAEGIVHAGVQTTLADHTAGAAGATLVGPGEVVLTTQLSLSLLRPARAESLTCRAQVLKPGRTASVVESEVFALAGDQRKLVAKATVHLSVVAYPPPAKGAG